MSHLSVAVHSFLSQLDIPEVEAEVPAQDGDSLSDSEDEIQTEDPTLRIGILPESFTNLFARVLDSETGRMNWQQLAAGFGFSTEQV